MGQGTEHELMEDDIYTGNTNAYLCKRKQAGGVQFSRDPLNLVNKHSRKYEGYCNDQAIGITPDSNTVKMITKVHTYTHPHRHPYPYTARY